MLKTLTGPANIIGVKQHRFPKFMGVTHIAGKLEEEAEGQTHIRHLISRLSIIRMLSCAQHGGSLRNQAREIKFKASFQLSLDPIIRCQHPSQVFQGLRVIKQSGMTPWSICCGFTVRR